MSERVPPHDKEAEMAVVASCLTDEFALVEVQGTGLLPEHCYRRGHETILRVAFDLARSGSPVDIITVRSALGDRLDEVGGWDYLVEISTSVPTTANAGHYAGIVTEKARRRAAIRALSDSMAEMFDPATVDPVSAAQARMMGIDVGGGKNATADFGRVVNDAYAPIWDRLTGGGEATKTSRSFETGLYDLDQMAWVEPGELVILGARPKTGKTALALQLLLHIAKSGKRVLFHSVEMGGKQIALRYMAAQSGASTYQLRQGSASFQQRANLTAAVSAAHDLPIRIDDTSGVTMAQIAANLRREMLHDPVDVLVVDHLLEVKPDNAAASPHVQMTQIVRDSKRLAKQTGVSVVALYQLSRGNERENRKPRMSDLRESGTIEEVADHVWLLWRPESGDAFSEAEVLVEKNRNGATGTVLLDFNGPRMTFACREHEVGAA